MGHPDAFAPFMQGFDRAHECGWRLSQVVRGQLEGSPLAVMSLGGQAIQWAYFSDMWVTFVELVSLHLQSERYPLICPRPPDLHTRGQNPNRLVATKQVV